MRLGANCGPGKHSLDDLRSNDLAGTAPGGEAVKDHEGVLLVEGLLEVLGPGTKLANRAHDDVGVACLSETRQIDGLTSGGCGRLCRSFCWCRRRSEG